MGKIKGYIKRYLFGLAGLAFLAHIVIPHDHHTAESLLSQDGDCPVHEEEHGNPHKGLPIHCHAFNDLASEKEIKQLPVIHADNDITDHNFDDQLLLHSGEPSAEVVSEYSPVPPDIYLTGRMPLRAPPAFC